MGSIGCFSFYPSKNLGACGDAGVITTDDDRVAERCRGLRNHAQVTRGHHTEIGYNSRLDSMQAALLRVKLPHLAEWNDSRRRVAAEYDRRLAGIPGLAPPPPASRGRHVYHQYTVRVPGGRDAVGEALQADGIGTAVYYPAAVNRLPPYAGSPACPEAERAAREVLSLPIWPGMSDDDVAVVAASLERATAS